MKPEHRELVARLRPARRILVVDDHAGFRSCARALLTAEGFDVVGEAADGDAALVLAAELEPELVLLDVQLTDPTEGISVDGFEVASRLLARNPDVKIVLVSSRDRGAYGPLIERSGAIGFISKGELAGGLLERVLE
jgi:DNA-binding NarL/FixJ family response regulator